MSLKGKKIKGGMEDYYKFSFKDNERNGRIQFEIDGGVFDIEVYKESEGYTVQIYDYNRSLLDNPVVRRTTISNDELGYFLYHREVVC